ncbi:MAG TPA: ferrous iron transporter B, partial [Tissierellaceae bacterium]|nr:ferrous iron transporter B [Tissierellaceae bacterium]
MNTIALVGNPNSGKTTLFNALTGSNQHVGNWPGVTVEKKEGKIEYKGKEYKIVDLPGTYSLGAHSEDEVIARDFILKGNPDIVINVVDATNIERNLYLTTQLMEMDVKVVLALNMMDEAKSHNIQIDINKLSHALGIPIVATVASKKIGIEELIENSIRAIEDSKPREQISYYDGDIAEKINNVKSYLKGAVLDYPTDWVAIKLLEGDNEIINHVREHSPDKLENKVLEISGDLEECELQIISNRYDFISNIVKESIVKPSEYKETLTDKIDKIVTHKIWGLPIFAVIMFVIFQLT